MADLDILIHAQDEPALNGLLQRLAYEPSLAHTTPRHRCYALARYGQVPVFIEGEHPDNPHWLDVHVEIQEHTWGLRYELTEDLWHSAHEADFGGAPGLVPAPSALLQHLLIHVSADMLATRLRLIRLYDIALVARRLPPEAWQEVLDAGRQRGEERLLYAPLALAERYFGCQVPMAVWDQLRRGTPAALVDFLNQADAYLLSFCNPLALARGQKLSWYRPGRERLMALRERVLPAPEDLHKLYPDLYKAHALPVAYLVHIWRAVTEQIRPTLHLPRRSWHKATRLAGGRQTRDRTGLP